MIFGRHLQHTAQAESRDASRLGRDGDFPGNVPDEACKLARDSGQNTRLRFAGFRKISITLAKPRPGMIPKSISGTYRFHRYKLGDLIG